MRESSAFLGKESRSLGPLSRFGDGDGSYWDRLMTTVGVPLAYKGTRVYATTKWPDRSSYAEGNVVPRLGYKRHGLLDARDHRSITRALGGERER